MPANRPPRTSGPTPRTATPQPLSTLVGRAAELATLASALSDADAGHGRTVLVVGESGIGKTHLVTAFAEQAASRGFTVAIGRTYPVEQGVPYAVFSDALLPVLRNVEPSVLTLLSRGGMAELTQLFPALATGGERTPAVRGDPTELKARLFWNFSQFLSRFAAKRPLLLVLENLQWADSASLETLHFVARQITNDRIVLVGTHNDPDHRGSSALRATDRSLRSLGNAQRVRL
ncbi:MAG: ATP-binding protein, partial [Gemmatimonadaceae bacterium]